jgi:hypothetical protein
MRILYSKYSFIGQFFQTLRTEPVITHLGKNITTRSPFCFCAALERDIVVQLTGIVFSLRDEVLSVSSRIVACELSVPGHNLLRQVAVYKEVMLHPGKYCILSFGKAIMPFLGSTYSLY